MHNKELIFNELKNILQELFETDVSHVTLDSKLHEDLDLDSIDAVDMIVRLQSITKHKFTPEEFSSVKTVSDVVEVIYAGLNSEEAACEEVS